MAQRGQPPRRSCPFPRMAAPLRLSAKGIFMNIEELLQTLGRMRSVIVGVATGGQRIGEVNDLYRQEYDRRHSWIRAQPTIIKILFLSSSPWLMPF